MVPGNRDLDRMEQYATLPHGKDRLDLQEKTDAHETEGKNVRGNRRRTGSAVTTLVPKRHKE